MLTFQIMPGVLVLKLFSLAVRPAVLYFEGRALSSIAFSLYRLGVEQEPQFCSIRLGRVQRFPLSHTHK